MVLNMLLLVSGHWLRLQVWPTFVCIATVEMIEAGCELLCRSQPVQPAKWMRHMKCVMTIHVQLSLSLRSRRLWG
jgi:hypothetical protein